MQNFEQLRELLSSPKRIVITSHANPDGDALGSSLGLYHYLATKGHRLTVIMPTPMPSFLNWMPEYDKILVYDATMTISKQIIEKAEIIFSLDYNSLSRIDSMEGALRDAKGYKVMIDHHLDPDDFADAMLSDTTASSACELVYQFIDMLEDLDSLNAKALDSIFVGLLTDTGGFRYATSPRLFRIVADMLERGVNNNVLTDLVFNSYTTKRFKLLGYCIYECLELLKEANTGLIVLTQADYKRYNIQRGDLEGVVNFILRIRQIRCAAIITERRDIVKLSLRSKGDFSVQAICSKYFNGGGHLNASGGASRKSLRETVDLFKKVILEEYKEELTK
ncbi:MAG: hypothetical protein GY810_29445 [Aureispira sp.]|nr:hypothetical protein [Aureispira sp.]